ncbi:MAG: ribonucleotide-diphosphate reductase subunit beta, partial [Ligilactobacillus agilis]|nr:ribonucleotide-diphosphate reductase subunit beta [Ligilactobacillus agilis]
MENYTAINWNKLEDEIDKATWEKLTEQFWLDTRIPLSNDLADWRTLTEADKDVVAKVFGGLTLLDTLQSQDGMASLKKDVRTQHEEAVLNNIEFMESVHAKSYSSIFSTLNTPAEIDEIFAWTNSNELLQYKAQKINDLYQHGKPLE